jgi:serine/threonine protein kinase
MTPPPFNGPSEEAPLLELAQLAGSSLGMRPRTVSPVLESGVRFGKYQVLRLIRRGGMSEVYEALHLGLRKRVALKIMSPELAAEAGALERFVAEGENAARVRHPNVVDVTDVGVHEGHAFLIMALLEGEELTALYRRAAPLPISTVIDLLLPIASAVAHGHGRGVIHRDLKPENVFLHQEGGRIVPTLLDYGVSVSRHRRLTIEGTGVYGTPRYMSPEQARGEPSIDARTDQYALAVMLYEGVTGRLPHDGSDPIELLRAVACEPFAPPSQFVELPAGFEQILLRGLAHAPDDRFETTRDFASALLPYAGDDSQRSWAHELSPSGRFSSPGLTSERSSAAAARLEPTLTPLELHMVATFRPQPMPPRLLAGTALAFLLLLVGVVAHLGQQRVARVQAAAPSDVAVVSPRAEHVGVVLRDGQRVEVDPYVPPSEPPPSREPPTYEAPSDRRLDLATNGKVVLAARTGVRPLPVAVAKVLPPSPSLAKAARLKAEGKDPSAADSREHVAATSDPSHLTAPPQLGALAELVHDDKDSLAPVEDTHPRSQLSITAPSVRVIEERGPKVRLVE